MANVGPHTIQRASVLHKESDETVAVIASFSLWLKRIQEEDRLGRWWQMGYDAGLRSSMNRNT